MDNLALLLVLSAALAHATWNVAAKSAGGDARFALLCCGLMCLLWAPLAVWFGAPVIPAWGWVEWGVVAASAVVHVVYFLTLLRGYRVADLTVVYPVARGSAPLLSALCAVVLLGEALSALGIAGVLAIVGGVFLIAGGPALLRATHNVAARRQVGRGILWGAATGVLIAGYTLIDAFAVKVLLLSPILVDYFGNLLRLPLLAPLVWRQRASLPALWRAQMRPALVVAVLGPIGYVLVLFAMQRAPISVVAPARELSLVFAAVLGGTLLRERDFVTRLAGSACIAIGVALLVAGSR